MIERFVQVRTASLAVMTCLLLAGRASAQITPAAGYTPPDDTPSIKVGATIFADYTVQQEPKVTDADGNRVTLNSFNVARSYINVSGNVSHIVAFRVTPDITRETGVGSSLNGSYTFRLKYAFAQFNLDDWTTKGTWVRLGLQQTPWVDFMEGVYRYRFQGNTFEDREGYLSSSDLGVSFHYNFKNNYGDIHTGIYNGETYTRAEPNDQKSYAIRGSFRPLPMNETLRGLRITGFWDQDAYVKNAERNRGIVGVTFEHKFVNASFDYMSAKDQTSVTRPEVNAHGWSAWVTPRTTIGWEGLLRFDHLEPNTNLLGKRDRVIGGVAYWFPMQGNVSTALLLDVDNTQFKDFTPAVPTQRRLAVHMLLNF